MYAVNICFQDSNEQEYTYLVHPHIQLQVGNLVVVPTIVNLPDGSCDPNHVYYSVARVVRILDHLPAFECRQVVCRVDFHTNA